jgi:ubiquinone/menaquinone biosynthesis C-methylase UbiE
MDKLICKVCSNIDGNEVFIATEKMYGLGHEFEYFKCNKCKCLQIVKIPADISTYYSGESYYSYKEIDESKSQKRSLFIKNKLLLPRFLQKIVSLFIYNENYNFIDMFKDAKIKYSSKILDVGCGSGFLLYSLSACGFRNLKGVDPFIPSSIDYENGVSIEKKSLGEVDDTYDLVMLHHSFEHMSNPTETLKEIYRVLKPKSYALIRVPISSSYAYQEYGVNWVQLDAPRHFYLHTLESMQILAKATGFEIVNTIFDSSDFQFTGSEKYKKGFSSKSQEQLSFSKEEIQDFRRKARELNIKQQGDQACFLFLKTDSI